MSATRHGMSMAGLAMAGVYAFAPAVAEPPQRVSRKATPGIVFAEPARATFTSEKPLTKRQKRRLRGKAKP